MRKTVIQVRNLSKQYPLGEREQYKALRDVLSNAAHSLLLGREDRDEDKAFWALRDVSFEVQQGEVLGLIGHNGAGKSTLLKIISRITRPTEGVVGIRGRVGSLLEVGTGFHPELTGRENIYLSGAVLGMRQSEIERKFDEIVAFAEVERFLDTPVKRYSTGMYLRLAFAVAAHLEPDILLVDEVLAVGDVAFQKKCLGKMNDVGQEGRTVLFVSHNMDAIGRLCDRTLWLAEGHLRADGPTKEVVQTYLDTSNRRAGPGQPIHVGHMPRRGNGDVRVTHVVYSAGNAKEHAQLQSMGPLDISLAMESNADRTVNSVAASLYSQSGLRLVNADTLALGRPVELRRGRNIVHLRINALYLKPGSYVLGWWVGDALGRVFDHVETGLQVSVLGEATSGFGVRPRADGVVVCPFEVVAVENGPSTNGKHMGCDLNESPLRQSAAEEES